MPFAPGIDKLFHAYAHARHETVNAKIKTFNILVCPLQYSLDKHSTVFFAVFIITHLVRITSDPLFDC